MEPEMYLGKKRQGMSFSQHNLKEKVKRQGMSVSVSQLRKLADELEKETLELNKSLGLPENSENKKRTYLIPIINKTPECSDTWEIED